MSYNMRPLDLMVGWSKWSAISKSQMIVQSSRNVSDCNCSAVVLHSSEHVYDRRSGLKPPFKYCIIWLFLCRHVLVVAQLKRQCGAGVGRQRFICCVMLVRWESVESVAKSSNSTRSQICHQQRRLPLLNLLDTMIYRPYLTKPCTQTQQI